MGMKKVIENKSIDYSILMTIYEKDDPTFLKVAMESMINQTYKCSEFVIVFDGPVSASLKCVINEYVLQYDNLFKIIELKENIGLGAALKIGVEACKYEYIARMDSDDISAPKRCETILNYMKEHPSYSVVGCNCVEFINDIDNVKSVVKMPQNPNDSRKFAKKRVPIRHPSIIFKKSSVLKVENYKPLRRSQEYDLIVRMLMKDMEISNVPEILFYIRIGNDFYYRRGGLNKAKLLAGQRHDFYKYGFYCYPEYLLYASINIAMCLIPNSIRAFIYIKFLRKQVPVVKGKE